MEPIKQRTYRSRIVGNLHILANVLGLLFVAAREAIRNRKG
jgi:hypothetical protein